jgi:hypothetical protein
MNTPQRKRRSKATSQEVAVHWRLFQAALRMDRVHRIPLTWADCNCELIMPTKLRGIFSGPLDPDALETQVFAPVRSTDTSFSSVEKSDNQHRMREVCSG